MKQGISKRQIIIIGIVSIAFLGLLLADAVSIRRAKSYSFDLRTLAPEVSAPDGILSIDSGTDVTVHSTRFSLRAGTYQISVEYEADADYSLFIPLDNDNNTTLYLPAGQGIASGEFELRWPTDRAYMVLEPATDGTVRIRSITVNSDKIICTDSIFRFVLLVVLYVIFVSFIIKAPGYTGEKRIVLLAMLVLAVIINLPYYLNFYPGDSGQWVIQGPFDAITRFGIDTRAHLLRLEGDMYGFLDGQFPVVISPNFLNENGELTFLYPSIFLYPFALMRILGASMPFVFRLMCVLINIFTLISIYFSCRKMSAGAVLSTAISAIYLFEPHRLWVMFGQGAGCGAGIAYIFAPLAVAGVYMILRQDKNGVWLLALGVTGILQSHITSLALLLSLLFVLFVVFIKELLLEKCTGMKLLGKAVLIGLLMNLGVMVPFVYYYCSGVNTSALVWGNWDEVLMGFPEFISNEMSLFYLAGLIIATAAAFVLRNKSMEYKMALAMLIYAAVFFYMTTSFFPWDFLMEKSYAMKAFTDIMQLPERFYTIMAPALLLSILLLIRDQKREKKYGLAASAVIFGTLVYGAVINIGGFITTGPLLYDQVTGDMNSKQLFDYLPVRDDLEPEMEISGTASLSDWDNVESLFYNKLGTKVDYSYSTAKDDVYAEFPLLDYKGYIVWDENGKALDHDTGSKGRIRVGLEGDGNVHEIHIAFRVKPVFTFAYVFSLLFSITVILYPRLIKLRHNNIIDE